MYGKHSLRVPQGPRRAEGRQVYVRSAGHDTVAPQLSPRVRGIRVQYHIHGLVVWRPVELLLFLHDGNVHFHLFECTELREPWLRLVDNLKLGHLK